MFAVSIWSPAVVALIFHMQVGGSGIDLFGLYALAVIVNITGLLWACGVAMRFRSVQAAPPSRASHMTRMA